MLCCILTACAAPPAARVVPTPGVDADDGALDVTVRLPGVVRRGTTVEVYVLVEGRDGIPAYAASAIDFSVTGRGLRNARVIPIGGTASTVGFLGEDGTLLVRGASFGPRSRLGFTARFDVAPDAAMHALQFQLHASLTGGPGARSFVRNYVAEVVGPTAPASTPDRRAPGREAGSGCSSGDRPCAH